MSSVGPSPVAAPAPVRGTWGARLAAAVLVLLLLVNLPLFLCMPLAPDTSLYDLCARNLLRGGVHYRDLFDVNLPGMAWVHVVVRSLLGWRPEAFRLADFLVVALVTALLTRGALRPGTSPAVRVWTAVVLLGFYFSTSEYCQCQRDTWMLLPAALALWLRDRQAARLAAGGVGRGRVFAWGLAEGLVWGAAFWIKPQVGVPALACWAVSAVQAARGTGGLRGPALDTAGLLAGGLVAGAAGAVWLRQTGAWPFFLDIFLDWNREYVPGEGLALRLAQLVAKLFPWGLLHLVAVPVALAQVARGMTRRPTTAGAPARLAGLYLGWLAQVVLLQKGFDYHMVPPVMLAIAVLAGAPPRAPRPAALVAAAFAALALVWHPALQPPRLAAWPRCWRAGGTPELHDRLALTDVASWSDLDRVADYLAGQGVADGELTCYDWRDISLYTRLDVRPATRYATPGGLLFFFPGRRRLIEDELRASRQRYVVTDLTLDGVTAKRLSMADASADGPDGPCSLPPAFPGHLRETFPWSAPIVFRAGRYAVHHVPQGASHQGGGAAARVDSP